MSRRKEKNECTIKSAKIVSLKKKIDKKLINLKFEWEALNVHFSEEKMIR